MKFKQGNNREIERKKIENMEQSLWFNGKSDVTWRSFNI